MSIYEALYTVLHMANLEFISTIPFVYELIWLMKANLDRPKAKEWVKHIIIDHWDRTLKHSLHAAGNELISSSPIFTFNNIMFLLSHTNSQ